MRGRGGQEEGGTTSRFHYIILPVVSRQQDSQGEKVDVVASAEIFTEIFT